MAKRTFTKYPSSYVEASYSNTGYWKAIMRSEFGEYYAFTTGYDRAEARDNLMYELVGDEKDDQIFSLSPISESEYESGNRRFHSGERWS